MAEGGWAGVLIILGVVLVAVIITLFAGNTKRGEESDIEHLDHETRGDEFER